MIIFFEPAIEACRRSLLARGDIVSSLPQLTDRVFDMVSDMGFIAAILLRSFTRGIFCATGRTYTGTRCP